MPKPTDVYRRTQRDTVVARGALATLFSSLVEAVERTRPLLAEGQRDDTNRRLLQCQKVVIGLRQGLNPEAGEITGRLAQLYDYVERCLGDANITLDPARLDDALAVLRNLRDAYQGVAYGKEALIP